MSKLWRSLAADTSAFVEQTSFQDPLACRNIALARALADGLVDDRGRVDSQVAAEMEQFLGEKCFVLASGLELESLRRAHSLRVLRALQSQEIARQVQGVSLALNNRAGQILIRHTLPELIGDSRGGIEDRLVRVAVLSAWLTHLRQGVGSCFATAPAIAIQGHHPARFLADMQQLLSTGSLTRSVQGEEVSVPLLEFWGRGDLWRLSSLAKSPEKSPGLARAFAAAGLAPNMPDQTASENELRRLIAGAIDAEVGILGASRKKLQMAPAQILRRALLQHFQLTQAELERWEQSGARGNPLLMNSIGPQSAPVGTGARGLLCQKLLELESAGQVAFKSTADNALLRSWEYALASFSESKAHFQQWNLATSLGMQGESGGVQQKLVELINQQIDRANLEIAECRQKIDQMQPQVIYTQGKLQNASSDQELQWLKAEYYQVKGELDSWELRARDQRRKGEKLAILSQWFLEKCVEGLRTQFQEVYDPDLSARDLESSSRDGQIAAGASYTTGDAPAGFRLVAKEGRSLAASWTRVQSGEHFIEVLCHFFTSIEDQLITWPEVAELQREFSAIITYLIQHIRSDFFLKEALARLQQRSEHLRDLNFPATPWAYISGGSLGELLQQYCSLPAPPPSQQRWFDDVRDFWVYLIDAVQQLPADVHERLLANPDWPLLMSSPDHAFCLKPGLYPFCESWRQPGYPYSWIRDHYQEPASKFYADIWLSPDEQRFLMREWLGQVVGRSEPSPAWANLDRSVRTAPQLREHLEEQLASHAFRQDLLESFDSHLFQSLPLCDSRLAGERLAALFQILADQTPRLAERALRAQSRAHQELAGEFSEEPNRLSIPAVEIWRRILRCWCGPEDDPFSSSDDLTLLSRAGESIGLFPPQPVEFADSNWARQSFAFAINPGTLLLEIWCVERWNLHGQSMGSWRPWLDGSQPNRTWAIFAMTARPDFFQAHLLRR